MSASWADTLVRWRRERLPHGRFVPAATALVVASAVGREPTVATGLGLVWAWAAVAVLRLWDDLEDRDVDAREHPGRISLEASAGPLTVAVAVGLGALVLWRPLLLVVGIALGALYRLRPNAMEAALLLKYPVLVVLLRGRPDLAGLAAALLVYGGVLVDGDDRWPGAVACTLATLTLLWLAPPPGSAVLAVGVALPWVKPVLGSPGVLAGIVVELLAFHLLVTA